MYGVRAQNMKESTPFYEELAERSGGAYITFKNFGVITDVFLAGKTILFYFKFSVYLFDLNLNWK